MILRSPRYSVVVETRAASCGMWPPCLSPAMYRPVGHRQTPSATTCHRSRPPFPTPRVVALAGTELAKPRERTRRLGHPTYQLADSNSRSEAPTPFKDTRGVVTGSPPEFIKAGVHVVDVQVAYHLCREEQLDSPPDLNTFPWKFTSPESSSAWQPRQLSWNFGFGLPDMVGERWKQTVCFGVASFSKIHAARGTLSRDKSILS